MFSKIYFKALVLITLIVAVYTGVILFFVSPEIEERTIYLEESTGKAHLQEIVAVVSSTARELKSYEQNSVAVNKEKLKNITDVAFTLVEELAASARPGAVKKHIHAEVIKFQQYLSRLYQLDHQQFSFPNKEKFIREFIRLYRYDDDAGYFFINRGTTNVLHPIKPELEAKELLDLQDADGNYFIREFQEIINTRKEGFTSYKWLNPSSGTIEDKLSYVFYFEAFDWIIGTGVYFKEVTRQKQQQALDYVRNLRFGEDGYFFITDYDSVLLSDPFLQGKDMSAATDADGNLIFPPMVRAARENGESFHTYFWNKLHHADGWYKKLTFVKHFPDWAWVIGTGIYLDSVEREVETKNRELVKNLRNRLTNTKIGDTGYIYIFDSAGNMIIHPNSNIEGTNFIKLENPGKGSFIFDDLVAAYQSGENVLYYKWDKPTDKGNYVYDKVSWIDYNKDFDWYICSSAYIAEINSTAGRLKKYLWLTSFILLLMVLCIGAVYFKRLLKPIEILSLQAARVQEGKLSVRNRIRGSSEIGTLAQTFDNMLDTIQDNINFLDKKASERTRDLQETVKKLDFLASYDPMTGIYNRRKFFELAASRFDEDRDDLYAAMMDIDKFKKINDTYGHAIGDLVLSAVAATIKKQLQEDALFGRLGGEEFAIISHYASWREMETHIEQIRESIEKMEIQTENGDIIRCTISTGVAKKEHTLKDLDEFLNRADEFMYRAKGMGRNRTIFRVSDHS